MENCIFCKIIAGAVPAHIIKQDENIVVFLSLEGHPLIVPKKHIPDIFTLDTNNAAYVMNEAVTVSNALRDALECDGINLVQSNGADAGQDVFHFHLHVKPRWKRDDVSLSWDTSTMDNNKRSEWAEKLREILD